LVKELITKGYLPESFSFKLAPSDDTERIIRDRMKAELGGEVEVVTASGGNDKITASEVIEIKNIDDWKEALGKILAYSAFFCEHSKRIHLFGRSDEGKTGVGSSYRL
jgi:hypothetical protein